MEKDKINLLVVDDEEKFLDSMKKRLEIRGFNVIAVNRGGKAIDAARSQPVDIVLLDLKMPGMNGEQTLAELKKMHQGLEVVILTGHGSTDSVVECTEKGAYFYLQKPCELDLLLAILAEAYKRRVMKRLDVGYDRIDELLGQGNSGSPLDALKHIRELDPEKRDESYGRN